MIVNETGQVSTPASPFADMIRSAAEATGVNFNYLFQQAKVESGFNPTAQAPTSSARGLFQFTKDTWLKVVEQHGEEAGLSREASSLRSGMTTPDDRQRILDLRNNPEISTRMAAHFAVDNARALQAQGVQVKGATDLYLAHFLGSSGAAKFLNGLRENPNAPAASLLPAAANANKSIFYANGAPVSLAAIYERFDQKFNTAAPVNPAARQIAQTTLAATAATKPVRKENMVAALLESHGTHITGAAKTNSKPDLQKTLQNLYTDQPRNETPLVGTQKAETQTAVYMPRREQRISTSLANTPQSQAAEQAAPANFSVDDQNPISVDSLAKFLDSASKWNTDAGAIQNQTTKGAVARAATDGLRSS